MASSHPPEESDVRREDDDSLRGGGCGLGGWSGVKDSGLQCTMGTQADNIRMFSIEACFSISYSFGSLPLR